MNMTHYFEDTILGQSIIAAIKDGSIDDLHLQPILEVGMERNLIPIWDIKKGKVTYIHGLTQYWITTNDYSVYNISKELLAEIIEHKAMLAEEHFDDFSWND
jgi:hypothetical protein